MKNLNQLLQILTISVVLCYSPASLGQVKIYETWDIPEYVKPNPNLDTLRHYLQKHLRDPDGFGKYEVFPSEQPLGLKSTPKANEFLTKQMQKTALLSYLYWEKGVVLHDEISPQNRLGSFFKNDTKYRSNSVGKSIVSYILGHAICEGYIESLESPVDDWPLIENTLYHEQRLLDLVNMKAGDKNYVHDSKGLLSSGRWYNVHSIKSFADRELKGSKPQTGWNNSYHYNGLVTNIIMNYVIHKTGEDFGGLLNKIFGEKVKIENSVYFFKNRSGIMKTYDSATGTMIDTDFPPAADGTAWYMFYATRHDYLRIAIAILNDWKNDTCVGQYLKKVYKNRIPKGLNNPRRDRKAESPKSYGGQFHFDYIGMQKRKIIGLEGYGGQAILIDAENERIVVTNSVHIDYDWYELVHQVIKNGRIKN